VKAFSRETSGCLGELARPCPFFFRPAGVVLSAETSVYPIKETDDTMPELTRELKLDYIRMYLHEHGMWLVGKMAKKMRERELRRTGKLLGSLDVDVMGGSSDEASMRLSFLGYGRQIDMLGYHQNRFLTKHNAWDKVRERKETRWYAKTMYSGLGKLRGRILYELGNEELDRLKQFMEAAMAEE
jgi:hypothetical protein